MKYHGISNIDTWRQCIPYILLIYWGLYLYIYWGLDTWRCWYIKELMCQGIDKWVPWHEIWILYSIYIDALICHQIISRHWYIKEPVLKRVDYALIYQDIEIYIEALINWHIETSWHMKSLTHQDIDTPWLYCNILDVKLQWVDWHGED